ncbi:MAG: hypothetical protein DELT_01784 [Desulfovibrio sp.]
MKNDEKTQLQHMVKKALPFVIIAAVAVAGYFIWKSTHDTGLGDGFAGGNGRIEATEIDIAAKLAGRIEKILVREGDFVTAGQPLVQMQTDTLEAQKSEAIAQYHQAVSEQLRAKAQVTLKESDKLAAEAVVREKASDLDKAQRRLARSSVLSKRGAMAVQDFDDDETAMHAAKASLASSQAQVTVAEAAILAAEADTKGAEAKIKAAQATIARVDADIRDSTLTSPRDGRVQYRIAQEGEVLAAGGKVLNVVDLADVYMTFFLPGTVAGRLSMGAEARLVVDAAPDYPVPAKISFVASTAQFTPKTVETESERQKLMFRVKAQIDPALLQQYMKYVKTGLTGMAWVKTDPAAEWPASMTIRNVQ